MSRTVRRRLILGVPLLLFLCLAAFFWRGLYLDPHRIPSVLIGKPVPSAQLPWLYAPRRAFDPARLRGHVSLLHVWASWCATCVTEHAGIMALARRYPRLHWVGLDYKDTLSAGQNWLSKRGNPYQMVLWDKSGEYGIELGIYGTPELFIVDSRGIIRYKHAGPITPTLWRKTLLPLIQSLEQGR